MSRFNIFRRMAVERFWRATWAARQHERHAYVERLTIFDDTLKEKTNGEIGRANDVFFATDRQPMNTAPRDRDIIVWNPVTGEYLTRYQDGQWPFYNWRNGGVWYPKPVEWREYQPE